MEPNDLRGKFASVDATALSSDVNASITRSTPANCIALMEGSELECGGHQPSTMHWEGVTVVAYTHATPQPVVTL